MASRLTRFENLYVTSILNATFMFLSSFWRPYCDCICCNVKDHDQNCDCDQNLKPRCFFNYQLSRIIIHTHLFQTYGTIDFDRINFNPLNVIETCVLLISATNPSLNSCTAWEIDYCCKPKSYCLILMGCSVTCLFNVLT